MARPYYHFLPPMWRREAVLLWLKRSHAWLGLWGAVLGLLFGITGIVMNHRTVMRIPVAESTVNQTTVLADTSEWIAPEDFVAWAQAFLKIEKSPSQIRVIASPAVRFEGIDLKPPDQWTVLFSAPGESVRATHDLGSQAVEFRRTEHNLWSTFIRIHKADGLSVAWILLADMFAGGYILLSLTGLLFWSRLHGSRLAGVVILIGSCVAGSWAILVSGF